MNLFELFVKIGAKDEASGTISKITSGLGKGLATAAKVGAAAVTAVTAAAGAMSAAFIKGTSEVAQYGDNIDKMSQKMGISAEAYQEWDFIMQHSGTSMETLKAGMKTLANAVESGNDAFNRLGISQKDIAKMSQEELFAKTIEQLQKVENETERTYLAGQLLGKGATELGALLNTSAEDTEAMRKQVHELGGVMSNEAVKAAAAYQDSLQNMQTAFSGIQRGMLSEFLPSMVTVMDGLALIFSGNDSGIAKITEGVNQFADKLMEAVPKIFELGEGILSSLATAILDNLPTLTSTATSVIIKLVDGIVSALPVLAESAIEIIGSLTRGLSDSLPTIIESAVELINTLADGILNMLPQVVKLGLDLIVSLANGIAENLPALIPTVVDVILQIVNTLTNPAQLKTLLNAALTLVLELVKGVIGAIPNLLDAAFQIVNNLIDFILNEDNLNSIINAALEIILVVTEGLAKAIPQLIDAAIQIIEKLCDFLLNPENISMLLNMAFKLIVAIVEGLGKATVELVKGATKLIKKIVEIFKETDWKQIGKSIVDGLLTGLKNTWDTLKKWFTDAWDGLVGGVKDLLGIHSPSRVFAGIGKNMALGVGEGWDDEFGSIKDDIDKSMNFDDASMRINASVKKIGNTTGNGLAGGGGVSIVQNIYSEAKTAADLMQEAIYQQERAVLLGV